MKYYYHFTIVIIVLFSFSSCKKDKGGNNTDTGKEELLFKGYELLNSGYTEFYKFAGQYNGNAPVALYETGKWILNKGIAQDVYIIDSTYMYIVMNSEIIMNFNINYVDANGKSLYRGGPNGGNSLMRLMASDPCSNTIPNNNVLMWGAADNLNIDYSDIKGILNDSDVDFTQTELRISQCTPTSLQTINQFGLVLFDTHGIPDAMLTGSNINLGSITSAQEFKNAMVAAIGQENFELFLSGALRISKATGGVLSPDIAGGAWWAQPANTVNDGKYLVLATAKFIQSLPMLTSTIVFNNSCYSGATIFKSALTNVNGAPVTQAQTTTVASAFLSRNPIAYYGWKYADGTSGTIDDRIAIDAEENFIRRLADKKDSTGQAHLDMDGDHFSFTHPFDNEGKVLKLSRFNNEKYCYPGSCGETITDSRDGQTYKTVCIGDQVWMAENLKYAGAGVCFNNDPSYCENEGRLYSIFELINRQVSTTSTTVRGLCPQGWHVPSEEEYNELIAYCGGEQNAVIKLRSENWPIGPTPTNEFDFNLKPGQPAMYSPTTQSIVFNLTSAQAQLWTSSGTIESSGNDTYHLFETRSSYTMHVIGTSQSPGAEYYSHCRCVKD